MKYKLSILLLCATGSAICMNDNNAPVPAPAAQPDFAGASKALSDALDREAFLPRTMPGPAARTLSIRELTGLVEQYGKVLHALKTIESQRIEEKMRSSDTPTVVHGYLSSSEKAKVKADIRARKDKDYGKNHREGTLAAHYAQLHNQVVALEPALAAYERSYRAQFNPDIVDALEHNEKEKSKIPQALKEIGSSKKSIKTTLDTLKAKK